MEKKAQSSIELMIVTGAILFFFTLFFIIIQNNISEKNLEKENLLVQDVALTIQDEIALASSSPNGYLRTFTLPANILGHEYSMIIAENYLNIQTSRTAMSVKISSFTGELRKSENTIKKENETVFIN